MIARNLILIVGHTEMETSNYPLSIMCGASLHEQTSTAVYNSDWLHTTTHNAGVSESPQDTSVSSVSVTWWSVAVSADTEPTAERCDEER